MAGDISNYKVEIIFDTSSVSAGVSKATEGLNKIHASASRTTQEFGKFKNMMLGVFGGNLLTQGFNGVGKALEDMKQAVLDAQVEQNRLNLAMKNAHVNTEANTAAVEKNISAYSRLGFTHAAANQAMGTLITATGNITESNKLLAMSADLARYKNIDLNTAATILARGTQGSVKAFKELGITLDTNIPKNKAIAKGFDELNAKIGGQAVAYTKTFAGEQEVLKERINSVAVKLGTALFPILTKVMGIFLKAVDWISKNAGALGVFLGIVGTIVIALKGWAIAQAALNLVLDANPISLWIIGLTALGVLFVTLWNHVKTFREAMAGALASIVAGIGYLIGALGSVFKFISHIPIIGSHFKGVSNAVNSAAKSVGNFADSIDKLGNKQIKPSSVLGGIAGVVAPGASTGIVGNVPSGNKTTKGSSTKVSVKKAEKGIVTSSAGATTVNVYVDGNKAAAKAIQVGTTKGK
jgi:hypothetical protein